MAASPVFALPVTFVGSAGPRHAEAVFNASGGNLIVTLTNTSLSDVMVPTDVLTGVFFDSGTSLSLGRVSAILGGGSTVLFGSTDPGNVVGGEWAYKSGLTGYNPIGWSPAPVVNPGMGISSSGLGLFGPGNRFPGTNLQGPPSGSPGGIEYGITSAGDIGSTGNTPVTGTNALIRNSVVFTLSGLPGSYDPSSTSTGIGNVWFQYGTGLNEPGIPGNPNIEISSVPAVPEPLTGFACLLGLGALGRYLRRRTA